MRPDRRRLLRSVPPVLLASCLPSFFIDPARAAKAPPPAALLVPLSGANAGLGRAMARAGTLAAAQDAKGLVVVDAGENAAAAARDAIKKGARLVLGPLGSADVASVVAAAGGVPVLSFSNDLRQRESGAFLLGVTADQATAPLLHYARRRGVRRVAIVTGTDPWSAQVAAAAQGAAAREGLDLVTAPAGLAAYLRGGDAPDAVLAADDVGTVADAARGSGVQVLGAFTGLEAANSVLERIEGAWLCAPDPAGFAGFAASFESQNGVAPGIIAGLAYDAVSIAMILRKAGATDRTALLAGRTFEGVCGAVRFRADGSAARAMAILAVTRGRYLLADAGGIA